MFFEIVEMIDARNEARIFRVGIFNGMRRKQ